jgi:hypothetical protein
VEPDMRKQDRIQQQKDQDQSRHSGEPQSPSQSREQVKGSASEAARPPREPGKPLPLPE